MFACILPGTYAKRYLEFNNEDIDFLCKKCHVNAHKIYDELIDQLNKTLSMFQGTKYQEGSVVVICNTYKKLFLARYLKWRDWGKKKPI